MVVAGCENGGFGRRLLRPQLRAAKSLPMTTGPVGVSIPLLRFRALGGFREAPRGYAISLFPTFQAAARNSGLGLPPA